VVKLFDFLRASALKISLHCPMTRDAGDVMR
jgi:hypothetical protein